MSNVILTYSFVLMLLISIVLFELNLFLGLHKLGNFGLLSLWLTLIELSLLFKGEKAAFLEALGVTNLLLNLLFNWAILNIHWALAGLLTPFLTKNFLNLKDCSFCILSLSCPKMPITKTLTLPSFWGMLTFVVAFLNGIFKSGQTQNLHELWWPLKTRSSFWNAVISTR